MGSRANFELTVCDVDYLQFEISAVPTQVFRNEV